jgi:hypothetical protein
MNISVLGNVCIDKNTSEHASYISAGSPAMFIHRIYEQFPDCLTTIIASYGKDYLPYLSNINIVPKIPNSEKSLVYENISKNGVRMQKSHNREDSIPVIIDENVKQILLNSDVIFIAPLLPNFSNSYFSSIKSCVNKNSLIVLLPQGFYRNFDNENNVIVREFTEADKVLQYVDVLIVSDQDHPDMLSICKKWTQSNPNLITIITEGAKGAMIIQNNIDTYIPTNPVDEKDVVDSVGGGDTFSAGFAYEYKRSHDIVKAGKFANAIARQKLFFKTDDIKLDLQNL